MVITNRIKDSMTELFSLAHFKLDDTDDDSSKGLVRRNESFLKQRQMKTGNFGTFRRTPSNASEPIAVESRTIDIRMTRLS